ncbi:tetratricopeptide repeat protein [Actibacterium lipolyticum]|uniref:Tetratricopeptide repeat protein n=1 Tax=Actibacterium lipolyticum TaxID=1524263 RepID=A0A238KHR8_9RHOB|nr:tetratricopeptide repeat protein [Actibacterium lipolyticum]SMX42237.1 Tetratricopeptide repeat protein [Actibacterium lipolyticum]
MRKFLAIALLFLPNAALCETAHPCFTLNPNSNPTAAKAACTDYLTSGERSDEDRGEAYANRGIAQRELGQMRLSVADLTKAIDAFPDPRHMRMLAWTYRELGQPAKAEKLYTRVLKTDDHWQAWLSRCVVRQDQEKFAEAAKDCEQAILRDPDNLDALFFGARAYNFLDQGRRALPLASKARQLAPDDPRHLIEYVWALQLSGRREEARREARDGLNRFPNHPDLTEFLKLSN